VKKVLVAMSGGVDSSITAKLLVDAGYAVHGVYMKLHGGDEKHRINLENIDKVCAYLGISYTVLDESDRFTKAVIEPFVRAYQNGVTPNPCSICNRVMKFGALVDFADAHGYDYFATGHYVRCDGKFFYEAADETKDQSYFLFNVRPSALTKLIFPLGDMLKVDVKAMAAEIPQIAALSTQKESSEICFVETDYVDVLRDYFDTDNGGDVMDEDGNIVGKHKGYANYTVGKRKGFDVPLSGVPLYVKEILPEQNRIVVSQKDAVFAEGAELEDLNIFDVLEEFDCFVKVRYRSEKVPAKVRIEGKNARVFFAQKQFAVAKGQACVFYDGQKLLGGGYIKESF
jgi:tRNA-uridine 2-sulfurtransferase